MKKFTQLLFLFAAVFFTTTLWSQAPVNDDCAGLIDLGIAPVCPPDTFNNINATASDIGFDNNPSCFNGNIATHDVWFAFTCPDTLFNFRITLTGVTPNSIQNPQFAIYRGDCEFDGLAELLCVSAANGETSTFLDVLDLTANVQYFIRVSDWSPTAAPNWGNFTLCVAPIPPTSTVDQGGSTLCSGTIYDTGGPNGDYSGNENHTFTICPATPSSCINFTLNYYNIEGNAQGGADYLALYNGNSTSAPLLAQISGTQFSPQSVAGGGGVCFQVQATAGCLTLQFVSDGSTQFEGFEGSWECSEQNCPPPATLSINTNITPDTIIAAVSTPATTVTVTDINCPTGGYGTFTMASADNQLGVNRGLVLTSGLANLAIGPNNSTFAGQANNLPGDPDLDYLSAQQGNNTPSRDACIVELDVFVATDELSFEYVFGSDEYPEFVNSSFNDIFAFLVSGPGIAGDPGLTNNAKNIAVLPNSTTPVQINSVNFGQNWQYYRNNEISQVLQYDGLTSDYLGIKKSLTARTEVIPCNTYHLKLAVADRQDWSYDSGVFVSEIKGGTPNLKVQFASGIDYFIETCSGTDDQLVISLSEPLDEDASFIVTVGGTAILGTDYVLNIPPVITFVAGQTALSFPIFPLDDNLQEGTETITISLSNNFGCGTVVYQTLTIELEDNVDVNLVGGNDQFICAGSTLQLNAFGAVNYFWQPPGAVSNPFASNPTVGPITEDLTLLVTGTINNCIDSAFVTVHLVNPAIDVTASTPTNICQGTSVQLSASNNVNNTGLIWSPAAGLNCANCPNPVATPSATTTYTASVTIAGCTVSDQITINVDTLFFPNVASDTTICENYSVQLGNVLSTTTDYAWTPTNWLDDGTSSGPIATPDVTTTYTLVATSANNYCSQTEQVTVTVIPADVDIDGPDYREICLGTTVDLAAASAPAGAQVTWSPSFYVTNPTGPTTSATPDESVTIYATYNVNGCLVRDSVRLRVDSLPNLDVTLQPFKPIYCPGDTVFLISPTYEPGSFPDIMATWLPFGTQLTPLENWNMVIIATETHTFQRISTNRGCADTASVLVPVGVPPTITITANPSTVCVGEPVQLNASVDPANTKLEWDPSPDLSNTEINNPIATPTAAGQVTYSVSAPEADCPSGASITIEVVPAPPLNLSPDKSICPGDSVLLNNAVTVPGATYNWTSNPGNFSSMEINPTVFPTQTTTYTVVAAQGNCSVTRNVNITFSSATVQATGGTDICPGESAQLNAVVTGTGNGTFVWAPTTGLSSPTIANPTANPGSDIVYTVTYTYGSNCVTESTTTVSVNPGLPGLEITLDPTDSCQGAPLTLRADNFGTGTTFVWLENGQIITGQTADTIRFAPTTEAGQVATITVQATTVDGCEGQISMDIPIRRCLEVPNAFTPNGDEYNNVFRPVLSGGDATIVEFAVYSRWGQQVFAGGEGSATDIGWDGRVDGKDAPADTYVYVIRLRYAGGREETLRGDVTLLR